MSTKQDKTAPRTAADVVRRYNSQTFADAVGIATDARKAAEQAVQEVEACHAEIVKLSDSITLKVTGGEAGNTASIVLTVGEEEYTGEINLTGLVTFDSLLGDGTTQINGDNIVSEGFDDNGDPVRLTLQGGTLVIERKDYTNFFATVLSMMVRSSGVRFTSEEGLEICGRRDSYFGGLLSPTTIQGSKVSIESSIIEINGKQCVWMENDDGTYSLTGLA